jgi:predicted RNA-binding protein YlxR (DUF448 family)
VGCRQVRPRAALVRLVRAGDGTVTVDERGRMAGRGAWICANGPCVERGLVRERLAHVFRKPCRVPAELRAAILTAATAVTVPSKMNGL